jgi:hypothetical protein
VKIGKQRRDEISASPREAEAIDAVIEAARPVGVVLANIAQTCHQIRMTTFANHRSGTHAFTRDERMLSEPRLIVRSKRTASRAAHEYQWLTRSRAAHNVAKK